MFPKFSREHQSSHIPIHLYDTPCVIIGEHGTPQRFPLGTITDGAGLLIFRRFTIVATTLQHPSGVPQCIPVFPRCQTGGSLIALIAGSSLADEYSRCARPSSTSVWSDAQSRVRECWNVACPTRRPDLPEIS